jgi:hypothetical protein
MEDLLAEGFVVEDQSAFTFLPSLIRLRGPIVCLDGITLDVDKEIAILEGRGMNAWVQTRWFRYQAWVRGVHSILRYDAPHEHRPHAHKHLYDTFGTGRELKVIELVDEDRVPTLGQVIRELQQWHQANAARLPLLR